MLSPELADGAGVRTAFVHWMASPTGNQEGRFVYLDQLSRIKFSIATLHPVRDLRGCRVILNAAGERMEKVTGPNRPLMPAPVVRLQQILEASQSSFDGPFADFASTFTDALGPCVGCGDEHPLVNLCSMCLAPWHRSCSQAVSTTRHFRTTSARVDNDPDCKEFVSQLFHPPSMCHCCAIFFSN